MAEANDDGDRVRLLQFLMEYNGRYHDHKETMAWAATAFYIGGVLYAALSVQSLIESCSSWRTFFIVMFSLFAVAVLVFMRWQFHMR